MKDYKEWLKYKHDICSRNGKKQEAKWRNNEITTEEYCESVNKYPLQLMDLYQTLKNVYMIENWSGNYECMIYEMELREHNRPLDMEYDISMERCILKCSIVLYEQYLQKKKIYKIDDFLMADLFSETCDDDKFTEIKDRIIADLSNNIIYKKESIEWIRLEARKNPDDIENIVMHPIDRLYKRHNRIDEDEDDDSDNDEDSPWS